MTSIDSPAAPSREHGQALLADMLRIRRFEERCAALYGEGKIRGFLHLYVGEEAVAVGVFQALRPEDAVVATYREHGHALLKGISANAVMAEMFGKATGCSRGRGGSMHLFDAATRFYSRQWAWRWPTTCAASGGSPPASSATGPWPRGSSTSR
jgi:pyruvate dehydrogenase E1 component alpha subunit